MELVKYPRTHHIEGSRFQSGDEDLDCVPFQRIKSKSLIIEEKLDGANSAISFDENGKMFLQSRGHFLTGGERERHFDLFKQWAHTHCQELYRRLKHRYIAYGEWLYAKHTVFYDNLPHYWLEFDVYDRIERVFLCTERRTKLFLDSPVKSVGVLHAGKVISLKHLQSFLAASQFINAGHMETLRNYCLKNDIAEEQILMETDPCPDMEGLYIKVEEYGIVKERYKFIRRSFLSAVLASESHWLDRPIVPNQLRAEANIFEVRSDELLH